MREVRALQEGEHFGPRKAGSTFAWRNAGPLPAWVKLVGTPSKEKPAEEEKPAEDEKPAHKPVRHPKR